MKVLYLTILAFIFSLSFASALDFDNVKNQIDVQNGSSFNVGGKIIDYNKIWEDYKPIEVKNGFGLGKEIMKVALTEHDYSCGINCKSGGIIYTDGSYPLFTDIYTLVKNNNGEWIKKDIRNLEVFIKVGEEEYSEDIYEWKCSDTGKNYVNGTKEQICSNIKKEEVKTRPIWAKMENGEFKSEGTYEFEVRGEKKESWEADWVMVSHGEILSSMAVWGAGTSVVEVISPVVYLSAANSGTTRRGFEFITKQSNLRLSNLSIDPGDFAVSAELWNESSTRLLAVVTIPASKIANFNYNLAPNVTYQVYVNGTSGTAMTYTLTGFTPIVGTYINYTNSLADFNSTGNNAFRSIMNLTITTLPSTITINSPINYYNSSAGIVLINSSATVIGAALVNMTLYTNESGTFAPYFTYARTGTTNESVFAFIESTDGNYLYGVRACDSDNDCGWSENRTLTIDTTTPVVNITYPTGTISGLTDGQSIDLNYSVSDSHLSTCWREYNGVNTTIPSCANTTFTYVSGVNTIKVWANDSAGNRGRDTKVLSSILQVNSASYSLVALSTSTENFTLNITYNSSNYSSVIARLYYNNTYYASTIVGSGNTILLKNSIALPSVSATTTKTFYWTVTLDSVEYNSSSYSQNITTLAFGICSGTLTAELVNFTTKSATNPFPTINATFKSDWDISATPGGASTNYSFEDVSAANSTWRFCTNSNSTIYANAHIEYDGAGYAQNTYYLDGATLKNSSSQLIYIYLLNDSLATTTVLNVRNYAQEPLEDVTIHIQFYDVGTGTFYTVGMAKTDFKGEDIAYLNWYDTLYKFTLIQNGAVIKITNTTRISETPYYFDIGTSTIFTFDKFKDFVYSLYFNNVTNNFVLSFTKPSGEVDSGCLKVVKRSSLNDTTICNLCETSASATLSCNINGYGNGTYIAVFYATGSYSTIDWISRAVGGSFQTDIHSLLGNEDANFYAFTFAGIVMAMMFIHPIMAIIGLLLGLLGASALGFTILNYSVFLGIAVIGGFIIWIIRR